MISFIVSLVFFMEAIDGTALNTAIPAMAATFHVNPLAIKMALISYLMSLAIFIPISGWLADRFGSKRVFISAVTIFTLSSIACGLAKTLPILVLMRLLQGIGASITMPVGRLILVRTYGREKIVATMNTVVMIGAVGFMLGPFLGGFITQYFSWHWIFWLNIPIGFLAIAISLHYLTDLPTAHPGRFDFIGFIFFALSLSLMTMGFSLLSEIHLPTFRAEIIIGLSLLFLIFYCWHSYQHPHPIINSKLFYYRSFLLSFLGNLFSRLSFSCVPFLLPLMLQIPLAYPPQTAGLLLSPIAIGIFLGKPLLLSLLRLFGYKYLLITNSILLALLIASFGHVTILTTHFTIVVQCCFLGLFTSLQYGCMNSLCYAEISSAETSSATSILSTLQALMQSFSIGIAALLIRLQSQHLNHGHEMTLTLNVFHRTFYGVAIIMFFSVIVFSYLNKDAGADLISARHSA